MLPFFFFLAGLDYSLNRSDPPIHQGPYTKLLGFKCPYTCLFLYRKKLQMSTFLVYLYKKKPLRALKHPYTSIHPYTKFCAQIPCSNSVLRFSNSVLLCYPSHHQALLTTIFSPCFTWPILSLAHSALAYITSCAQRTGLYYLLGTAHWPILPLGHSALAYITSWAYRSGLYYLLYVYFLTLITLVICG